MNVWMDGISVLVDEWRLVGVILIFVFISWRLIHVVLSPILGNELTTGEYFSLGIAGWLAPVLFISMPWILLRPDSTVQAGLILLIVLLLILPRFRTDLKPVSISTNLFLIPIVLFSNLFRLAYVSGALFPLYFDSAQHYFVIKSIMENDSAWIFNWLKTAYYHPGFHFLTAFFTSISQVGITRVMLILGQMILSLIPFSLYFLVRNETKSSMAGWFAVILSAFGWYMPAHAVDWGKYPALMSLGLIPFVLSLGYLLSRYKDRLFVWIRWLLYGILGLSALLTILTHSRSSIILGIVFLACLAGMWWQKLPQRWKSLIFVLFVIITLLEVVFIQRQSILTLLFDPYLQKGILITIFVVLLSIFAWMGHPHLTFVSMLTMTLLLGSLFIPVTWIPGYRDLTLLDRPYVEMILFLPLSLLGGLGLSGLEKKLQGWFSLSRYIGLFAIGIVALNAVFTYDPCPSDCCVIVGNDDVLAMDWIVDQLPVDARIGISSTQLKVISETSEGDVGADAGIWITPLTGRVTFPLPYNSDFDAQATWDGLCQLEIGYLYVGEKGYPFNAAMIDSHPEWYRPLLSMPKTWVYEVIGCE